MRHSRSPAIHNAAFRALGLDWVYLAFEVAPGRVPEALAGMRALGIRGLSVTLPHKEATAAAVDELSATAAALGAANTVVVADDGRLRGENTDAAGFLASLADAHVEVAGRRCLVRGAGGAARAVVWALADAGASEVVVVPGRVVARAEATALLAGAVGRLGTADEVAGAEIVVNATPLGLERRHRPGRRPRPPRSRPGGGRPHPPSLHRPPGGGRGPGGDAGRRPGHARPPGGPRLPDVDGV